MRVPANSNFRGDFHLQKEYSSTKDSVFQSNVDSARKTHRVGIHKDLMRESLNKK